MEGIFLFYLGLYLIVMVRLTFCTYFFLIYVIKVFYCLSKASYPRGLLRMTHKSMTKSMEHKI